MEGVRADMVKDFYPMADELHRLIVDYYGGEAFYTMYKMEHALKELTDATMQNIQALFMAGEAVKRFGEIWEQYNSKEAAR